MEAEMLIATRVQSKLNRSEERHPAAHGIPNVGRFAILSDPQGAVFAIIKLTNV